MGKQPALPKLLCQRTAIKLLTAHGWTQTAGGKHVVKMDKPGRRPVTLPSCNGEDYSLDLTRRILKAAGIINNEGVEG